MKIVIVNGSHRKNGATARILNKMYEELEKHSDVEVKMVHVSDLKLQYCIGCGSCYKTGSCIYKDDIEKLSNEISDADGIILGSPTYASNISGQMKVIIDRGHFVIEQLLYGKYAISVTTYENYGGKYKDISRKRRYIFQELMHNIVLRAGIKPFVKRKGEKYEGVIKHWEHNNIVAK